jgi:hypothetical protein
MRLARVVLLAACAAFGIGCMLLSETIICKIVAFAMAAAPIMVASVAVAQQKNASPF